MNAPRNRSGFSLAEILVAIAIIAVVAAVVIPSIGGQLRSGDESRVQQDLTNIRSGIEQFLADVRRYPKSVGQLTNAPTTAHSALVGGVYISSQVARWRGPYLTKDSAFALKTGYDATITSAFDTLSLGNSGLAVSATGTRYLRIFLVAFDSTNALRLDQKMDDGDLTTGQIRWTVNTVTADTLYYLTIPVQ
jgi:prepilin-type N-terminal cleavage/methylation domain-containing protein